MVDPLPGFAWNPKLGRYQVLTGGHGLKPGTMVARKRILGLLETRVTEGQQKLQALTQAFMGKKLTAQEWQISFASQLKTLYLQEAALGAGGWDRLTASDFGRVGGYLRTEYRRLTKFAQDVIDDSFTEAQFLSRARMYAGKARGMYFAAYKEAMKRAGYTEVRRVLGEAEHCDICIEYEDMGWQPIDTFPPPGTHPDCYGHCKCTEEYR